jgi:class 3 adenylate cyclase/tetratricopeptide (TPR) repeat protein
MSVGIHSGQFHYFLVGDPDIHRELIVSGPAASRCAEMEAEADAGEIGLSPETAALLDPSLLGEVKGGAVLLCAEPVLDDVVPEPRPPADGLDLGTLIPPALRGHLLGRTGGPEHRQIAVAFVQFSGTDDLLAEHGPDTLAHALDECVRTVQHATTAHGVTFFESDINRDGGKIMLTAGAPVSADHDEERMLRAARRIVERVGVLPVRIGINRGPVFAGDFGPTFRRTFSVKGDAINLAARVMGKAEPGQVLATTAVLERSSSRFDVEPLPPFLVKGKSQPVSAASVGRLLAERAVAGGATPMVGREEEMRILRDALAEARSGRGLVVDLAGEPGIGKSRLVSELLGDAGVHALVTRCDEYERETAYWPFRSLLRDVLGVPADADDDAVLAALTTAASESDPTLVPWLPLVADVLDVDAPPTPEVTATDARFRKARLEEVTASFLERVVTGERVVVFDDVHLMDEASADLLEHVCRGLAGRHWLVLVTRRAVDEGFRPSSDYPVVPLRPPPLTDAASAALVEQALRESPLPPHDVAALAARAGGNPLFLRGLILAASTGAPIAALPDTVEALITSQIDRLPSDERLVLRFASVLGVRFHESELRALLHGHDLPTGRQSLRRLSYFLHQEGHGRLRFDHQLVRDTAYEGLPYRLRLELHGRAGDIIEQSAVDPDDVAELLSLHFTHADKPEKAWYYSRLAGERATQKNAYAQAEELLARAAAVSLTLKGLDPLEVVAVNRELGEARFRLGRNQAAIASFRVARRGLVDDSVGVALLFKREAEIDLREGRSSVALRTLTRGLRLLDLREDEPALTARSRLKGIYATVREAQGRYREAHDWARRAQVDAERSGDPVALADALEAVHVALSMQGKESDEPYGERALALYERVGDRVGQSRALNNLAVLAWIQGRGSEALEMFQRAEVLAAEAGDTVGAAATRYNIGDVLVRLGRSSEAEDLLRALVPVLQSLGVQDFLAACRRALGVALVLQGDADSGRTLLDQARVMFVDLGESAEVVETDAAIALALLAEGQPEAARMLAAEASAQAFALDAGYLLPWLLRLHGAALVDLDRADEAETVLAEALRSAQIQSRIEVGFVLAEQARAASARGDDGAALERARASEDAFDVLGFVGSTRYPRHWADT